MESYATGAWGEIRRWWTKMLMLDEVQLHYSWFSDCFRACNHHTPLTPQNNSSPPHRNHPTALHRVLLVWRKVPAWAWFGHQIDCGDVESEIADRTKSFLAISLGLMVGVGWIHGSVHVYISWAVESFDKQALVDWNYGMLSFEDNIILMLTTTELSRPT